MPVATCQYFHQLAAPSAAAAAAASPAGGACGNAHAHHYLPVLKGRIQEAVSH
jgi:hypothetical protein